MVNNSQMAGGQFVHAGVAAGEPFQIHEKLVPAMAMGSLAKTLTTSGKVFVGGGFVRMVISTGREKLVTPGIPAGTQITPLCPLAVKA